MQSYKKKWYQKGYLKLIVLGVLFGGMNMSAYACQLSDALGKVRFAQGAWVEHPQHQPQPLQAGEPLCPGSSLNVPADGQVEIELIEPQALQANANRPMVNLGAYSSLQFHAPQDNTSWFLHVLDGWFRFFSPRATDINIKARYLTAGVRGTEFVIQSQQGRCSHINQPKSVAGCDALWVQEGTVAVCPDGLSCDFNHTLPGQESVTAFAAGKLNNAADRTVLALPGQPLRFGRLDIHPDDAVNWVLYYPPLVHFDQHKCDARQAANGNSADAWLCSTPDVIQATLQDPATNASPEQIKFAMLRLIRAGASDRAFALLKGLASKYKDASLYALHSVIALKQNKLQVAQASAGAALKLAPESVDGLLALSYVRQAEFDLNAARQVTERAAELNPEEPLILARLAELSLSLDESSLALQQAQEAVRLAGAAKIQRAPVLSRAWTVLGFVHLVRSDMAQAKDSLQRAIEIDGRAPLPQLGLGLALVREGELDTGLRHLEQAVALDPRVSLYRSYLGKAYLEQNAYALAEKELQLAKHYDSADPTPWLYDTFRLQLQNQPVAAFKAIEESLLRNDQRAVYRSRLLLDQDKAVREVNHGRVYRDLGFDKLALLQGAKSVGTDPGDYSGHRLLADGYANRPRHEIARVSELLQAQLRQPVNIGPIQPQLTEADLFTFEGTSPGSASINEYTTLFNQDDTAVQASVVMGSNATLGDELVVFGVEDQFSYSLSQYRYQTDGVRENNDLTTDIANAFVQYQVTPDTNIQAEYRFRENEQGDLRQFFDSAFFSPTLRENDRNDLWRVGMSHDFSSASNVIAALTVQNKRLQWKRNEPFSLQIDLKEEARQFEVQHLLQAEAFDLISGIGHFTESLEQETFTPFTTMASEEEIRHTNAYLYAPTKYFENIQLTVGASFDQYDGVGIEREQFNPKLGVVWDPTDDMTLRAAAFRTHKRTLISNQTLEPTSVAGFNQFFDDATATDAWRYGLGLDYSLSADINVGAEISKRELKVPSRNQLLEVTEIGRHTEQEFLAYGYWVPNQQLAISAEYRFEQIERENGFLGAERIAELDTHSLALQLNYFMPSGWTVGLRTSHIMQDGLFNPSGFGAATLDEDNFWVVDLSASYRLPEKRGLFSVDVRNLFDQDFQFQGSDLENPEYRNDLGVFANVTLFF
jgi:outer membrane receptor protein involved in Fe transport/Tfp pilus assembly protein PilF